MPEVPIDDDAQSLPAPLLPAKRTALKFDSTITLGNLLHMVVLLVSVIMAYAALDKRISLMEQWKTDTIESVKEVKSQTERIERYLARDPKYWRGDKD